MLLRGLITLVLLTVLSAAGIVLATAQSQTFTPRDESPEEFPAGPGRDDTFYTCTACHNFKLVAQQGMSRRQWEETLVLMTEKHGMPPLDPKDREAVLGYLETAFAPNTRAAPGGWKNPFTNQ